MTIAQLRAVLAILQVDAEAAGAPIADPAGRELVAERVVLLGFLHRVVSAELRRVITATMTEDEAAALAAAESARPVDGESLTEQASFDAHWLHDRIDALAAHSSVEPVPALLEGAARSADAAEALLLLSRSPRGAEAEARWRRALDDLSFAYHLINDEHVEGSNTLTQPIR